jgi:hypothetical protein
MFALSLIFRLNKKSRCVVTPNVMKVPFIITLVVSLLTLFHSAYGGEEDWKKLVSSQKLGSFPLPKPIQLTYSASFQNLIESGKISFVFGKKDERYPQFYISQSFGGSYFKTLPYNFDATSFANPKSLTPKLLVANEVDDSEQVKIFNTYSKNSVSHKKTTTPVKSKAVEEKSHVFSGIPIHDPLTALLFVRSQKLDLGDKVYLCIHPFSDPYFCTVTVLGKEQYLGKNCIKLDIALRKIDKETSNLKDYKKLKHASIWISDDAVRIPLEFRIQVNLAKHINIGSVRLNLIAQHAP